LLSGEWLLFTLASFKLAIKERLVLESLSSLHIRSSAREVYDACRSVDVILTSVQNVAARVIGGRREGLSEFGERMILAVIFSGRRIWLTTEITHAKVPYELNVTMIRGTFRFFEHRYRIQETAADPGLVKLTDELAFESEGERVGKFLDRMVYLPKIREAQKQHLEGIKKAAEDGTFKKS
jgi:ribosome-associated toxin RatA of RatAB toxin-antitoxin module